MRWKGYEDLEHPGAAFFSGNNLGVLAKQIEARDVERGKEWS